MIGSKIWTNVVYRIGSERPAMTIELAEDVSAFSSVVAKVLRPDASDFDRNATIIDAPAGIVRIDWVDGDLSIQGNYIMELVFSGAGAVNRSSKPVVFLVRNEVVV
jgi:hypothetical protein